MLYGALSGSRLKKLLAAAGALEVDGENEAATRRYKFIKIISYLNFKLIVLSLKICIKWRGFIFLVGCH